MAVNLVLLYQKVILVYFCSCNQRVIMFKKLINSAIVKWQW